MVETLFRVRKHFNRYLYVTVLLGYNHLPSKILKGAAARKTGKSSSKSKKPVRTAPGQRKQMQSQPSNSQAAAFYRALSDPFNPSSMGCQVPDPFPFPTATFHVHQTTVIGPATGTNGAVAFLPNPIFSMVDVGRMESLSTRKSVTNTPFIQIGTDGQVSGCFYGAVSATALSNVFSTYRVVSWGIKVSNLQAELNATGRFFFAQIPIGDTIPSLRELLNATDSQISKSIFGVGANFLSTTDILEYPTAFELTVGDLMRGDVQIAGMYTNSSYWNFKTTQGYGVLKSGVSEGDSVSYNDSTGTIFTAGNKDPVRSTGASAIVMYYEGIPTAQAAALQIETIYHLEGTPNFNDVANGALVPSTMNRAIVGNQNVLETAMSKMTIDNAVKFVQVGASFLNKANNIAVKAASMLMGP